MKMYKIELSFRIRLEFQFYWGGVWKYGDGECKYVIGVSFWFLHALNLKQHVQIIKTKTIFLGKNEK